MGSQGGGIGPTIASRGSESDAGDADRLLERRSSSCELVVVCFCFGLRERVRSRCLLRLLCLSVCRDRDGEDVLECDLCLVCLRSVSSLLRGLQRSCSSLYLSLRDLSRGDLDRIRFRRERSSSSLSCFLLCRYSSLLLSRCRRDDTPAEASRSLFLCSLLCLLLSSLRSRRLRGVASWPLLSLAAVVSRPSGPLPLSSSQPPALFRSRSIFLSRARDSSASFARSAVLWLSVWRMRCCKKFLFGLGAREFILWT